MTKTDNRVFYSTTEICEMFGVSRDLVMQWAHRRNQNYARRASPKGKWLFHLEKLQRFIDQTTR